MKPKPCKLQLAQPINPLPFDRIIKFEADVIISFTPKATGEEAVYERAHIVMLTDLFLVCEWTMEEGRDTPTLFLCFPPLAARHLKVLDEPMDLGELSRAFLAIFYKQGRLSDDLSCREHIPSTSYAKGDFKYPRSFVRWEATARAGLLPCGAGGH